MRRFKAKTMVGDSYGWLTVVERAPNKGIQPMYRCKCVCGGEVVMRGSKLRNSPEPDCGCRRKIKIGDANRKHGFNRTPTYSTWCGIKHRCGKLPGYENIELCERWQKFENFLEDMGVRPEGKVLDRIDNMRDYEPGNCQWSPRSEASKRSRKSRSLTANGITQSAIQWANTMDIPVSRFYQKLNTGDYKDYFDDQ